MNKKVVIRLALDKSPEVHAVPVRTGWSVAACVDEAGDGLAISGPYQGNIITNHIKELAARDRRIRELEEALAKAEAAWAHAEEQKRQCEGKLRDAKALTDRLAALLKDEDACPQPAEGAAVPCFNEHVRLPLIVRELKAFVESHSPGGCYASEPWRRHYWPIVHQLFVDLHWWQRGTDGQFVQWVNALGIDATLTMSNYKAGKSHIRGRAERWYVHPAAADDDYGRMGHALFLHFADGYHLNGLSRFEMEYIDRSALRRCIPPALSAGTTHMRLSARVLALVDSAGLGESAAAIRMAGLAAFVSRHVNMGTFAIIDNTKPGRRRRGHAPPGLRKRRGLGQLTVRHHL